MRGVETDETLMVRVQAGDEGALAILMDRYKRPLFAFLHRRAPGSITDDLFQESWLRVVRARARFDPRRRFSTWLFQIANNLCRDRARRLAVEHRHLEAERDAPAEAAPADAVADRLDVARRLEALPERLREVLVLRYFHDQGEREIAEILEIPRGTVKSRLHAAIQALRSEEAEGGA